MAKQEITIEALKARAYDLLVAQQKINNQLQQVNTEIIKLQNKESP